MKNRLDITPAEPSLSEGPICAYCRESIGSSAHIRVEDACFCRKCIGSFRGELVIELLEYGQIVGAPGLCRPAKEQKKKKSTKNSCFSS